MEGGELRGGGPDNSQPLHIFNPPQNLRGGAYEGVY
jgi:hypothetical protein